MKNKIIAAILCVLAALGLVNVGKTLTHRFFDHDSDRHATRHSDFHAQIDSDAPAHLDSEVREATYLASGDEVIVDRRFKVEEGGLLDLSIGHADVTIESSGDKAVTVRVTLTGRDVELAREYFESMNFDARQDGNRIIVKTEPSSRNWNWRSTGGAEVDVDVFVPRRFNAKLSVAHGDLEVADLVGSLELRSSHGDATVGSIDGEKIDVKMAHGDLELGSIKARSVRFTTAHGDLMTGPLNADELNVKSAHGDIELDVQGGRSVEIVNSHGEITLTLGNPVGGSIRNSHGDIEIDAPDNLAANVVFHADKIRMSANYSFQGSQSKSEMKGAINGGGPTLKAHTSFGSIAVN